MNRGKFLVASLTARTLGVVRRSDQPRHGTRVVMYHDINENGAVDDVYSIPVDAFTSGVARLAEWSRSKGHPFVPFTARATPGIAVTFDDGYRSTLLLAAPVFEKFGIPFHVFVTKSFVEQGDSKYLSRDDVKKLSQLPLATLGVHGVSHRRFSQLDESTLRAELAESRDWLEQLTGTTVTTLSYPHGDFTLEVSNVVRECGFDAAACSAVGTYFQATQSLAIPRVDLWSLDTPSTTVAKVRGDWDSLLP